MADSTEGVPYDLVDPFKVRAQKAARATAANISFFPHLSVVPESWGESAFLVETPTNYIAHVIEGLGTKTRVVDFKLMRDATPPTYYDALAYDTVATVVNDMATVGAWPVVIGMFLAFGNAQWLTLHAEAAQEYLDGVQRACHDTVCVWGGGETQILANLVQSSGVVLAGASWGIIEPKSYRIAGDIHAGDAIVLLASSGIHANGLTTARDVGLSARNGYRALLSDGKTYGKALLEPSIIYLPVVRACQQAGVEIHGAAHITGHGWAKLMRSPLPLIYVVTQLPEPQPVFTFIQEQAGLDDRVAYGTFNMGVGFALYVPRHEVDRVIAKSQACGVNAWLGGYIEESDQKTVVLNQKGIVYTEADLAIR